MKRDVRAEAIKTRGEEENWAGVHIVDDQWSLAGWSQNREDDDEEGFWKLGDKKTKATIQITTIANL